MPDPTTDREASALDALSALGQQTRLRGRIFGTSARRVITSLTLFGVFASTVCWPLSAFAVERVGWRGACFAYATIKR